MSLLTNSQTPIWQGPLATLEQWSVLGPFQIGTREAPWGADPLEFYGGFRMLEYDEDATFRSSIAIDGTVGWSKHTAKVSHPDENHGIVELSVGFPDLEKDWAFVQSVYGWAAKQWQGWARGEIFVHAETAGPFVLHTEGILELWIDDVHYFGGDMYEYGRAPVTLRLEPGRHSIDVRLVRDGRVFGAVGAPAIDAKLRLERSKGGLSLADGHGENVLLSEAVGGTFGPLASPYASIAVRNDAETDIQIHSVEGMEDSCVLDMLATEPVRLVPGQTRPISFKIACVPSYDKRLYIKTEHTIERTSGSHTLGTSIWPKVRGSLTKPHRVTFMNPGGMVSYAILRPPSEEVCRKYKNSTLPVLLALHGAGLEADNDDVAHMLDDLPDLAAWVLFPTGVTPWSGDDWHVWGWVDVEAAVEMIPKWIEQVEWHGPDVDTQRWLVAGHSNGGQGAWYALTHKFDKTIAMAALSGYSSIQNYVPYTFWHSAEPARMAIVHAAMNSYRHELLLENAKGIPVLQQHGSADDNVPVYHSRLLSQRMQEAEAESAYYEFEGKPHFWDGMMTTRPMSDFLNEHLHRSSEAGPSPQLASFSIVVANPSEAGFKFGIKVFHLIDPGHLGRIDFTYDQLSKSRSFHTSNVEMWIMPATFQQCQDLSIDGQKVSLSTTSAAEHIWVRESSEWRRQGETTIKTTRMRDQNQLGRIDAILRTKGAFKIIRHSPGTAHIALQLTRNLHQYFAADTEITDDYEGALRNTGNIISLAIGPALPDHQSNERPISIEHNTVLVGEGTPCATSYSEVNNRGLGAIFISPLPNGRLELVVWGQDARSLAMAARLVPLMPGSGQPDFVVIDDRMMWQGVEGARALGFFDTFWKVSRSSFLG